MGLADRRRLRIMSSMVGTALKSGVRLAGVAGLAASSNLAGKQVDLYELAFDAGGSQTAPAYGQSGDVAPALTEWKRLQQSDNWPFADYANFLLAHPLFLLGAYLTVRYKNAVYLMFIGVIGQLSLVDTFAHLHTPLHISLIRITYGLVFGALIGLILIAAWEIVTRSWKRWVPQLSK